jgi:hypothetical protein
MAFLVGATLTSPGDDRLAPDDVDLVLLHEELDAVVHLRRNGARSLDHPVYVHAELFGSEAIILGMGHMAVDFGRTQQRLGRNAAPVGADPGHMFTLDNSHLHAELGTANGGNITAGAGADDKKVVLVSHLGLQKV